MFFWWLCWCEHRLYWSNFLGYELVEWGTYLDRGGLVYPLSLFAREHDRIAEPNGKLCVGQSKPQWSCAPPLLWFRGVHRPKHRWQSIQADYGGIFAHSVNWWSMECCGKKRQCEERYGWIFQRNFPYKFTKTRIWDGFGSFGPKSSTEPQLRNCFISTTNKTIKIVRIEKCIDSCLLFQKCTKWVWPCWW